MNHKSGVSRETAEQIRARAAEMGYAPDPVLSSLMRYRQKQKSPRGADVMAFIHGWIGKDWPKTGFLSEVFTGVEHTAPRFGYKLARLEMTPQMTAKRLNQILISRAVASLYGLTDPELEIMIPGKWVEGS